MGDFLPQFLSERAGKLLFAFLKPDGDLRHRLCGTIWRQCVARLISDDTRHAAHKYLTTTYPNFMQCAGGLEHGARWAQLLNMLHVPALQGVTSSASRSRRSRGSSAALLRLSHDSLVRETGLVVVDSESLHISENLISLRRSTTLKILPPSSSPTSRHLSENVQPDLLRQAHG